MNKFSFGFYLNEAKWQQVDAMCSSLQRPHGNASLKWKLRVPLWGEKRAFAKLALDSCRDLHPPSEPVTPGAPQSPALSLYRLKKQHRTVYRKFGIISLHFFFFV